MAFKINKQRVNVSEVKTHSFAPDKLHTYQKQNFRDQLGTTSPSHVVSYFLAIDYSGAKQHLLILGEPPTAEWGRFFNQAAKGKHGFKKKEISVGICFLWKKQGREASSRAPKNDVLYILQNKSCQGEKTKVVNALKLLRKNYFSQKFKSIEWLDKPVMISSDQQSLEEISDNDDTPDSVELDYSEESDLTDIVTLLHQEKQKILRDLNIFRRGVIPRYQVGNIKPKDIVNTKKIRTRMYLFLMKLAQLDGELASQFTFVVQDFENNIIACEEIEAHPYKNQGRAEAIEATNRMNALREEMMTITPRVKHLIKT